MEKRKLGRSNLEVTPFCFGGNVFGWTIDERTSFTVLDAFVEVGGNFIDTADVYSAWVPGHQGGESETVLGNWFKSRGNRDRVILATKVGMPLGGDKKGLSASYIKRGVEDSLKRLQTDYIDLYQSHEDDESTPLEETLGAYADLVKEGKVRVIGASNYTAKRLGEALKISEQKGYPRYESLQPPYSLANRSEYERDLEPFCREHGIGVISYSSLANGFLSGKYRSGQDLPESPRAQGIQKRYMNEQGFKLLAALDAVAKRYNATVAQISLAWLIARPGLTAPIVSATSLDQLQELLKSVEMHLDQEAIQELDKASAWK